MTCGAGIRLWDTETNKQVGLLDRRDDYAGKWIGAYCSCLFFPHSEVLVGGTSQGHIRFWDWKSGQELGQITSKIAARCLGLSPDAQTLVACGGIPPEKAVLWELSTRQVIHELQGTRSRMPCVSVSPDGVLVANSDTEDKRIILWNLYTGKEYAKFEGHQGSVFQIAFSPDGRTLASASKDGTLLFWKVPELEKPKNGAEPKKLNACWEKLAGENATSAYEAIWDLRQAGDQAVAFMKERVKTVAGVEPEMVTKLVADLDAPVFATRKKAADELAKLGEQAEPALRKALEGDPSAEMRKQVQSLLSKLRFPIYHGEALRDLRAIQVLERIGTPKAREVLEELAKGAAGAKLTRDAKAAAARLKHREAEKPASPRP